MVSYTPNISALPPTGKSGFMSGITFNPMEKRT